MAINLMVAVLDRGPSDLAEMAVLLAIADSADRDTGEAWPSQRTIARRARQSDRNVRNVLDRLRAGGWLTWEARKRDNGSQASNVYSLNLEQLGEAPRGATTPPERASTPPGSTFRPPRNVLPPTPRNVLPALNLHIRKNHARQSPRFARRAACRLWAAARPSTWRSFPSGN